MSCMRFSVFFLSLLFAVTFCRAQDIPKNQPTEAPTTKMQQPKQPVTESGALIQRLMETGKTGIALLLVSIIGFSFAFERLFHLRRVNIVPRGLAAKADKLWRAHDYDGLRQLAHDRPCTLSRVIKDIVDHRNAPRADVSIMAGDVASREMRIHLQRAYPLAVVATISPLLGLFGTVYGMIGAFESVALAGKMGDPSIMAGDIAFALMTTAIGLVIAVPSLSAYHFFRIRSNMLGLQLEEQASHIIDRWYGGPETPPVEDDSVADDVTPMTVPKEAQA